MEIVVTAPTPLVQSPTMENDSMNGGDEVEVKPAQPPRPPPAAPAAQPPRPPPAAPAAQPPRPSPAVPAVPQVPQQVPQVVIQQVNIYIDIVKSFFIV